MFASRRKLAEGREKKKKKKKKGLCSRVASDE